MRTTRWAGAALAAAITIGLVSVQGIASLRVEGVERSPEAATTTDDRQLDRLVPILDRLAVTYGNRIDPFDARRLARRLDTGFGMVIDRSDVDHLVALGNERIAIADELAPWMDRFGQPYGSFVDPGDALLFAQWLRVPVGEEVDLDDLEAMVAAAEFEAAHPRFAMAADVLLRLPSHRVEVIGYHQSNHDGARDMTPHGDLGVTMESRNRDTASRGSADVALPKDAAVYAPVSGRVLRSGTYTLYCDHSDDYLVIEPDDHPGWEVKLLHIDGVRVHQGDRVEAGITMVAPRPTQLPFESQVNDHTAERDTPHVHIEVVDPSIKDRPSPGGGC